MREDEQPSTYYVGKIFHFISKVKYFKTGMLVGNSEVNMILNIQMDEIQVIVKW